jgi:hypothetical protein
VHHPLYRLRRKVEQQLTGCQISTLTQHTLVLKNEEQLTSPVLDVVSAREEEDLSSRRGIRSDEGRSRVQKDHQPNAVRDQHPARRLATRSYSPDVASKIF